MLKLKTIRRLSGSNSVDCRIRFIAMLCIAWSILRPDVARGDQVAPKPPYLHSEMIERITWDWKTLQTAAPGSDLWPVTWTNDDSIFTAFGDGGGFGGTDSVGRVAAGFARIDGPPEHFVGINLNGGLNPKHGASYPLKGKAGGVLAVGDRLYAWLNTQQNKWPNVDEALIWSDDGGLTWQQCAWVFAKGEGNLRPSNFLNFGKGYTGLPDDVGSYVYFYGQKQGNPKEQYLGRSPTQTLTDRAGYEFLSALESGQEKWSKEMRDAVAVFSDNVPNGDHVSIVYSPALKRYLLTSFHSGPGQLGVFDSPHPWGPWTTVAYEEHFGGMSSTGEGLICGFPAKWMSADGLTLWCIFSAYNGSAKEGINAHDKLNLVRATLELKR